MKIEKIIVTAAVVAALYSGTGTAGAELRRGEKSFGPRVGYVSRNKTVAAGLQFEYAFSRHVRIAPEIDIAFRRNNADALAIGIDMHFPFSLAAADRFAVYPLAGVSYTSWGIHGVEENKDVTTHENRFGINAGGGVEFRVTPSLKLSAEGKYIFMKDYGTAMATARIAYVF